MSLGVVSYLNMQPLVYGLAEACPPEALEIRVGPPRRLARWLEEGSIDVGMVPVAALFAHPQWAVAAGGMIGARGPVRSVLVAGSGPPEAWRVLRPDSHSLTSNALARVLLKETLAIEPAPGQPLPEDDTEAPDLRPGEACVLIGTHALAWGPELAARPGIKVIDLGEAWTRWTALPFVFAVWAARPGIHLGDWPMLLDRHLEANLDRLDVIARAWTGEDRMTAEAALNYFRDNIDYRMRDDARRGLQRFYAAGRTLDLFPAGWSWRDATE